MIEPTLGALIWLTVIALTVLGEVIAIALRLFGVIDTSWPIVLSPIILFLGGLAVILAIAFLTIRFYEEN